MYVRIVSRIIRTQQNIPVDVETSESSAYVTGASFIQVMYSSNKMTSHDKIISPLFSACSFSGFSVRSVQRWSAVIDGLDGSI